MDYNKLIQISDNRSDSHPTRQRLQYLAKLNQNSANEQKVRENNNKQNKRLNHSNETIKKIRTYQKVIYDKDNNSRIKTYYREAPGEDSTNGVDPVGEFITEGAALSPLFKLAGTGLLYGAGRLGSNWARSKIISETMNKNLMGVNQYLNGTYGEATDYLFDKLHPELSKIGSKDQYKQYLYRMMPTSSTDKIYYHGSNSNFSDGLNSATKGAGAPETGNEMYFAKQPATVLQYVDGINTGIKDTNGFGHWNKLWWQAKEMLGNGQKDGWKAKTITQLRQQIPISSERNNPSQFQSELDWSPESWFKLRSDGRYDQADIDALKSHVLEYNKIEQEAKANGTWLKMKDGSTWEGDPRIWVQMQSKSFINNANKTSNLMKNNSGDIIIQEHLGRPNITTFDSKKYATTGMGHNKNGGGTYSFPKEQYDADAGKYTKDAYIRLYKRNNNDQLPEPYYIYSFNRNTYKANLGDTKINPDESFDSIITPQQFTTGEKVNPNDIYSDDILTNFDMLTSRNPNLLKSVIGNNGDFNLNNSNIYKSLFPIGIGLGATSVYNKKQGGKLIPKDSKGAVGKTLKYHNAKNEFGSDVAIVFDPKNNVNFLGSKADQNSFINFVNGGNHKLMLGYHFLYGNK